MTVYYNEFDPKAAAWLRQLISDGMIAPGEVDTRSINDVQADDLRGFTQCHFFAGIGGWSYALRLAGWADDRPCWTGSPPCQPFSNAGKQKAQADARHLWPVFFNLIRECRPANIFGEQVEAAIRTGWLDDLQDDLEAENYAVGKIVLPACSVGAPHIRKRLFFGAVRLADANSDRAREDSQHSGKMPAFSSGKWSDERASLSRGNGGAGGLADTNDTRPQRWAGVPSADELAIGSGSLDGRLADTRLQRQEERQEQTAGGKQCSEISGLAFSDGARWQQGQRHNQAAGHGNTTTAKGSDDRPKPTDAPESIWRNPDWLWCRDGKWRPVESEVQRVVDGLSDELVRSCNISPAFNPLAKDQEARTMRLKGYGNAIVPPLAAEFIKAYLSIDFGNA